MKKIEKTKGITLVALVVTIIVLLLLAGIAIASLGGENGIFAKVKQAKKANIESEMKEQLTMGLQKLQHHKVDMEHQFNCKNILFFLRLTSKFYKNCKKDCIILTMIV